MPVLGRLGRSSSWRSSSWPSIRASRLAPGFNSWASLINVKFVTPATWSLPSITCSNAPWRSARGRLSRKFGQNGKRLTTSPSHGRLHCWGKLSSNERTTCTVFSRITLAVSPTLYNLWTFSEVSYSTISGLRGAEGTSTASTLLIKSSLRPGLPRLRSVWPLGRPLDLTAPPRTPSSSLALSLHLERNGYTWTFLGRTMAPLGGISSPLCTICTILMIDGAAASLPARGSLCVTPWHPYLNGVLSWDSQGGVLKLFEFGFPGLCEFITLCSNLWLGWGLKQACSF
jgi:hypothetical protein